MPDPHAVRAFLEDRHLALAKELDAFAKKQILPLPPPPDDGAARRQARTILELIGRAGFLSCAVPKPDLRACALVREALAAASPLADAVFALQALGALPIALGGSETLKRRWLNDVVHGRSMAAFAMTETEAGSDVSAIRTRAHRKGDAYLLEGAKTLISNAGIADFYTVFASTDPAKGAQGLSCFVVESWTPGLRFMKAQVLSAPHPLGQIAFEQCRISASCRVGAEGEGFKIGMRTLDRLRATVGAAACGMAARALEEAKIHALRRRQFGKPLAEFQSIRQKLAALATELDAARLLVYRAAWEADRGAARVTVESAMAKAFATEAAQRIVDGALQILGGIGCLADHPVERLYRSVRALRIYEGATEVQHLVIANHLLQEKGK